MVEEILNDLMKAVLVVGSGVGVTFWGVGSAGGGNASRLKGDGGDVVVVGSWLGWARVWLVYLEKVVPFFDCFLRPASAHRESLSRGSLCLLRAERAQGRENSPERAPIMWGILGSVVTR